MKLTASREEILAPLQSVIGVVERRQTMLVEDVHAFPDHIACDAASRSELVVPLIRNGRVFGVIDLDSPLASRFDLEDQRGIEAVAEIYVKASNDL